jgi:imidazolonepropionase-like amidohydrolase/Tol biopolymer transport system component
MSHRVALLALVGLALSAVPISAQESPQAENRWRTIEFETTEVTEPDVTVSPDGEWLVFTILGHLFRVSTEGGDAEQLTFGLCYDQQPAFAPDGGRIAFVSDRDGSEGNIFILNMETRDVAQLTDEFWATTPSWSPDGETLAYLSIELEAWRPRGWGDVNLPARIRRVAAAGGEPESVNSQPELVQDLFHFGDGRLAWVTWSFERPGGYPPRPETHVETLHPPEGSDTVLSIEGIVGQVLAGPQSDRLVYWRTLRRPGLEAYGQQAWIVSSPIGEQEYQIAALTQPGHEPRAALSADGNTIYIGNAGRLWAGGIEDGSFKPIPFAAHVQFSATERIPYAEKTFPTPGTIVRPRAILTPRLSPGGDRLVFGVAGHIWEQLPGQEARRLFDGNAVERNPEFSPDGKRLAFIHSEPGADEIRLLDIRSGRVRTVVQAHPLQRGLFRRGLFSWSPNGEELLWFESGSVVAASVADGTERVLTEVGAWSVRPHLSRDGRSLFFSANRDSIGSFYRLSLEGSDSPKRLTDLAGHLSDGLVSGDGRWLAFRRNTEIWVAAVDGGVVTEEDIRRLSDEGGDGFSFTPDGSAVIYAVGDRVWRQSLETGERSEIPLRLPLEVPTPTPLLIRNVRVLDFETGGFSPSTTILVERGRIAGIGPEAEGAASRGAEILDGSGRYAIPGLFDMHVHVQRNGANDAFLAFGITSVRDCGVWLGWLQSLADRSETTPDPFPRYFYSGGQFMGAMPAASDTDLLLHDADEAREYVRRWRERGADFIKVYALAYMLEGARPRWVHRAIAEEARAVGIPMAGHGKNVEDIANSVMLGIATVEHSMSMFDDVLQLLSATGTRRVPTLNVEGGTFLLLREEPERLADPILREFTPAEALKSAITFSAPFNRLTEMGMWEEGRRIASNARRRGVRFLAGTDVYLPGEGEQAFVGSALHWELEHLVELGFQPLDVLRIATHDAAETVGAEADLGTLEVGKLADIVLLDADPLEEIRNTQSIWRVIKGGWVFDPEELQPDRQ